MNHNRWYNLSFAEQLGNIGSELSRARHWDELHDLESRNKALERGLDLIDLMLADKRWHLRIKELTRLREAVSDCFMNTHIYDVPLNMLEKFCLDFALRARMTKV